MQGWLGAALELRRVYRTDHCSAIHGKRAGEIEPQAGKLDALDYSVRRGRDGKVAARVEPEPIDRPVSYSPDDVLGHAVALVRCLLLVQIARS